MSPTETWLQPPWSLLKSQVLCCMGELGMASQRCSVWIMCNELAGLLGGGVLECRGPCAEHQSVNDTIYLRYHWNVCLAGVENMWNKGWCWVKKKKKKKSQVSEIYQGLQTGNNWAKDSFYPLTFFPLKPWAGSHMVYLTDSHLGVALHLGPLIPPGAPRVKRNFCI